MFWAYILILALQVASLKSAPVKKTPSEICAGKNNGHFPVPDDYGQFLLCVDEEAFILFCPEGLVWSITAGHCDDSSRASNETESSGDDLAVTVELVDEVEGSGEPNRWSPSFESNENAEEEDNINLSQDNEGKKCGVKKEVDEIGESGGSKGEHSSSESKGDGREDDDSISETREGEKEEDNSSSESNEGEKEEDNSSSESNGGEKEADNSSSESKEEVKEEDYLYPESKVGEKQEDNSSSDSNIGEKEEDNSSSESNEDVKEDNFSSDSKEGEKENNSSSDSKEGEKGEDNSISESKGDKKEEGNSSSDSMEDMEDGSGES